TWTGALTVTGPTMIKSGVTVTIAAGTHITAANSAMISVAGKLEADGTSAGHVVLTPTSVTWGGVEVTGQLVMHYVAQSGGGIVVDGGTVAVADSVLSHDRDGRDFLIVDSGQVDVEYSAFQPAQGTSDLIHCDMHANQGGGTTIKVVHSNLSGATYGF